jgi:hypothetical protein
MGPAFVLLFFLVWGVSIVAIAAGKRVMFFFGCLAWTVLVFLVSAVANDVLLGQDAGLGDSAICRLPDGFDLVMIDRVDRGRLRFNKHDFAAELGDLVLFQVSKGQFWGGSDMRAMHRFETTKPQVTSYFVIDSNMHSVRRFPTESALRHEAAKTGVKLELSPVYDIYWKLRNHSVDFSGLLLAICGPIVWLWRKRGLRLRRHPV